MERRVSSPAKYRSEDRVLFILLPLFLAVGILAFSLSYFHLHPTGILAVLCAIIVSSPMIAFTFIIGLYLAEEKDEFQRSILVQSLLWSLGVTACGAFFWWGSRDVHSCSAHEFHFG